MQNIIERAAQEKRDKIRLDERIKLDRFNNEMDDGNAHKKIRIHTTKKSPRLLLTKLFNSGVYEFVWASALQGTQNILEAASNFTKHINYHGEKSGYMAQQAAALEPALAFSYVAVSEEVATQLEQEIELVRMWDARLHEYYARFQGPFLEERERFRLMDEFGLSINPDTGEYAHDFDRVQAKQRDLGCDGNGPYRVLVFTAIASGARSSRGVDVDVAEAQQEMTASDAQKADNARPVVVVPAHLHYIP